MSLHSSGVQASDEPHWNGSVPFHGSKNIPYSHSIDITPMVLFSLETLLLIAAIGGTLPILMLCLECIVASFSRLPQASEETLEASTSLVVLVPAHNEAAGIVPILQGIQLQLRPQDTLLVVADNCTDDTATLARATGARVVERWDPQHRGKGYALDCGLSALADAPPEVVVLMDADCQVVSGTLPQLAARALASGCPTQAIYLFDVPDSPGSKALISAFAIKVKNLVRPLGLAQLGFPSLLFGTGMAFPWPVLQSVDIASGHIVEDMKLGFDAAIAGHPPLFCPTVQVAGQLPSAQSATSSQRTRWEHGHLQVLKTYLPLLLWQGLKQRRFDLLALGLDLSVPPLSLLVILWLGAMLIAMMTGSIGLGWHPAVVLGIAGGLLLTAITVAWVRFARADISLFRLLSIGMYILWKIPLYLKFVVKPQSSWIRTERTQSEQTISE